ncbi:transporter substrate-binding domain-containing protein [Deinococcus sp. MIMF12]|uniref:Transporter substrate-binding domain-containing protein n=1 Tax=Deinococcus rhizophilus TaxID=3049544 RepID=A0ABT7JMX5_9DEIO|nr:transporter substrate-binding domain-containing protein [Deinococcus rhizophilus]MDL2345019.1 transporter substrate-binding domain-containing protein [Deinococcus rhizophilus]
MLNSRLLLLSTLALTATSVAHAELADVRKRGELRVVMSGEYPPFSQPAPDGSLTGFDADVAREIAKRLGVRARLIKAEFPSIIAGLQAGQFDLAVASQSKTPERERAVDFLSRPYYYDGLQLVVPASSSVRSLAGLGGKPVAVAQGTIFEKFLRDRKYSNVATYSGEQEIFLALGAGRAAGMVTTRTVGSVAIKNGQKLRLAGPVLQQDNPYITLGKNQPRLKAAVEKAMASMRADGTLKRLSLKYLGSDITVPAK